MGFADLTVEAIAAEGDDVQKDRSEELVKLKSLEGGLATLKYFRLLPGFPGPKVVRCHWFTNVVVDNFVVFRHAPRNSASFRIQHVGPCVSLALEGLYNEPNGIEVHAGLCTNSIRLPTQHLLLINQRKVTGFMSH